MPRVHMDIIYRPRFIIRRPVVYYAPPVRYYAPPVVYEPYDDVYFDRPLRRRYYGGW